MIDRIGVIYQDPNSLGLILGLRDRLRCHAEIVGPPTAIGESRNLTRRQAKLAWEYFQKKRVDLIVRFTDSDQKPWQRIRNAEKSVAPDEAQSLWISGVAVNNVEEWLCLDRGYLAKSLNLSAEELDDPKHRTGRIKSAIKRVAREGESGSEFVARLVRELPSDVFRRWLRDDSFGTFYSDCRAAAERANCSTRNELDSVDDAP